MTLLTPEEKYQKDLELCYERCGLRDLKREPTFSEVIDIFYEANHPDIYSLISSTRSGFTQIRIVSTTNQNVIVNVADENYLNAHIRAIGKFIAYQNETYKINL